MTRTIKNIVLTTLALFGLAGAATAESKPNLVLVSVGVSKFQHRAYERGVTAAAKDACDVAEAFDAQAGKFFNKVSKKVLLNEEATRTNIEKALAWARSQATADTYVVVFMASHGQADAMGQYNFVPHDANPILPSTNVSSRTIRTHLNNLPGKCILILDTCHAGGANRLGGVNFITLASCNESELSSEDGELKNGHFTRAFVEGFSGAADEDGDNVVTLNELECYIGGRLSNLSEGRQSFTVNKPATFGNTLALAQR